MINRRNFLKTLAFGSFFALAPNVKLYSAGVRQDKKLFLIILRGGLDGMAMMPPFADINYQKIRGDMAIGLPGENGGALNLDGFFGLHPALIGLKTLYDDKELIMFNAVATPYRNRSHFAVQDVLENGATTPESTQDGWLNRLVSNDQKNSAVALSKETPFILSGGAKNVSSFYPHKIAPDTQNLINKIADLYRGDTLLENSIDQFMQIDKTAMKRLSKDDINSDKNSAPSGELENLLLSTAQLMKVEGGANIAVLNVGGWDTHANQGSVGGDLAKKMADLSQALAKIKIYMGKEWKNSCFLTVTEFGRTFHINGTKGTDHGTASIAMLGGGAVNGKKILGTWPGLAPTQLFEKRDLNATTDIRKIFKSVISGHLGVNQTAIENSIFPDSSTTGYFSDLFH